MKARFRVVAEAHVPVADRLAVVLESHGLDARPLTARTRAGVAVLTFAAPGAAAGTAPAIAGELAALEAVRCAEVVFLP